MVGRRVLIVLDNARGAEQVRPLLPGSPGCMVLVTSRDQLTSLILTKAAACPVTLDLLTAAEACQLLASRLGPDRVAAEASAVQEIVTSCASLPLALAIVAARAATHPRFPLASLARELRNAHGGETVADARAVFFWSYPAAQCDQPAPGQVLIQHYDSAYSAPDYRIARAIWLQRQLSGRHLPIPGTPRRQRPAAHPRRLRHPQLGHLPGRLPGSRRQLPAIHAQAY